MRKALILIAVVALAGFGLAACGGDDDDGDTTAAATAATETAPAGGGAGGSTVDISAPADGALSFDQKDVTAKAGSVTINFDNPASISHDVKVEDSSGSELGGTALVSQGDASATVDLQPGSYTFFCSVPGHREAGMEGTLTAN
jgi:plastocyanin